MAKRLGNVGDRFLTYEWFDYAEIFARKNKMNKRRDIIEFHKRYNTLEKRKDALMVIVESIRNRTYKSSEVIKMERFTGGKWRVICTVDIEKRPLDYCGYVHYRTHVKIRKETKKKFIKNRHKPESVASYLGMLKWCNSRHLIYKTIILNNGKKCNCSSEKTS